VTFKILVSCLLGLIKLYHPDHPDLGDCQGNVCCSMNLMVRISCMLHVWNELNLVEKKYVFVDWQ